VSKKYKDKVCVYCTVRNSTCPDHVIGRQFFPNEVRANLPKVPCCHVCNTKKSSLETYAMALFPFGSAHPTAKNRLFSKVPLRLEKNINLRRELRAKMEPIWLKSRSGLVSRTITLPVRPKEIVELFAMILRGLYFATWNVILPTDYFVEIYTFTLPGLVFFRNNFLSMSPNNFVEKSLGNGVFQYRATRGDKDPGISTWEMCFYNGLLIAGKGSYEKPEQIFFCGLTGPEQAKSQMSLADVDTA